MRDRWEGQRDLQPSNSFFTFVAGFIMLNTSNIIIKRKGESEYPCLKPLEDPKKFAEDPWTKIEKDAVEKHSLIQPPIYPSPLWMWIFPKSFSKTSNFYYCMALPEPISRVFLSHFLILINGQTLELLSLGCLDLPPCNKTTLFLWDKGGKGFNLLAVTLLWFCMKCSGLKSAEWETFSILGIKARNMKFRAFNILPEEVDLLFSIQQINLN